MTVWTKNELLEALSNEILQTNLAENFTVDEVVIDSRKITKNGLFIALKGDNNDGHNYLNQAENNGCIVAIIENAAAKSDFKASTILVKNTFLALYKLAEFSRNRSNAKIIAVTGSVGKTSTKEMLKIAFSAYKKTFATSGNLNNHIGLPLSLANFSKDYEFGIFEMGMNHLNEIEPLSKLARPHLAIVTTVGPVHIEFFKNEEEIALAKAEIFSGLESEGIALINRDSSHFDFLQKKAVNLHKKTYSFGCDKRSDYCLESSKIQNATLSEVRLKNGISYQISSSNKTTIQNSVIIAATLDLLTKNPQKGLAELINLENGAGRGKISEISLNKKNITIIDDSYNASLPSIKSGLEYATELKIALQKKRVVVALGDMLELGEKSVELHEKAANYLNQLAINFAVLVGEKITKAADKITKTPYKKFPDSISASLEIENILQDGDILYVKGSRGIKMEKIIEKITNQTNVH